MKRCVRCVMDETDPLIKFDENGICNHCKKAELLIFYWNSQKSKLLEIIKNIKKKGKNKAYDAILGISGGVDSSYVAYLSKELGLKVLLVHVDSGWNNEIAVKNIENILKKTGFDLYTFVVEWEEMKDLQLAFFKAGVPNCDIPQDHAFVAAVYKTAIKFNIKYMLSGYNVSTESILPRSWGHRFNDLRHLKDIHKKFGKIKLKKYPTMNFFEYNFYFRCIKNIKSIPLLNFIEYNKFEAKKILKKEFNWKNYGNKHFESNFTKFFQSYYLPKKFNIDKRKAHLSSLIISKQITREQAIEELKNPPYDERKIKKDIIFVANKLDLTYEKFMDIIDGPAKSHYEYCTNDRILKFKLKFDKFFPCMDFNKLRY